MIFFIFIFPLVVFFIKKEASQGLKNKTSFNINKIKIISVGNTRILFFTIINILN